MKKYLAIGGLVAALAVGIVAVAGVGAQEATPTPSDDTDTQDVERNERVDHYLELLAANLVISVEELEEGLTQTHIDLVNEKVADGTLSEEEAAEIIERIESGEGRLFPPFGGGHHGGPLHRIIGNILESAAGILGMDKADLREHLGEGNSLGDVAEANGLNVDDFKAALQEDLQAKIDAAVADGTISEEMGQRLSEGLAEHIDRIVDTVPSDGPWGGRGPGRFFDGGPFGDEGSEDEDSETSLTF
ncbi:MAG TPA: hypothetical protein VMR52_10915 [Dehalococcoidia bacterium]|nr:hypothetical protein [Dehalococcoidia bacterium]